MGLMSAGLIDVLDSGKDRAMILEWTIAGTTYYYSKYPGVSTQANPYPPRVVSFGGPKGTILALLSGRKLIDDKRHVTFQEKDGDITRLLLGDYAEQIVGSIIILKLNGEGLEEDEWFTYYTGEVFDYGRDGPGRWTVSLQPPFADQLRSRIKTPIFTSYDFPDASDEVKNKECPLLLGIHDSLNTGRSGLLTALSIDTVNDYWAVSHGRTQQTAATFNVWDNSVLQTSGVDYNLTTLTVAGRVYSIIAFLGGAPTGPVTCDVEGMTDDGTTSGNTIINSAIQLKYILANWIFAEISDTDGYIIPADSPIEEYSFDLVAAFLDRSGDNASNYIEGNMTGENIINEILTEKNLFAYWNNEGKFSLAHCDWFVDDIYDPSFPFYLFGQRGVGRTLNYKFLTDRRYDEISAKHLRSSVDGDFLEQLRVKDPDAGINSNLNIDLNWSKASQ